MLQRPDWLRRVQETAHEHGALVIWDEVISGFRVALGGAAGLLGMEPDLVTFGKIVGGGLPCGAFAGPAKHFERLAPLGPVYQAGTLSGNPVAMAAGLATLEVLIDEDVHARLQALGRRMAAGMARMLDAHPDWPLRFVRCGSVFWFAFGDRARPRAAETIPGSAAELYKRFFGACLDRRVYLAPSAYEVGFLSTAHTEADVDRALEVFEAALTETFTG